MWYRLPYLIKGRWTDTYRICSHNASMDTSRSQVLELLSSAELPFGKVYCSGLGTGILALLLAYRDEVESVVVSEINPELINVFNAQGFDTRKIEIRCEDWKNNTDDFDFYTYDHYDAIPTDFKVPDRAVGKSVFYLWESLYPQKYEKVSFDKFCVEHGLVPMSQETAERYLQRNFLSPLLNTDWVIKALKYHHNYRLRKDV
jgi:hypothetical protein